MTRTQTMVQLTDDLVTKLDREAARRGVSRSALVREAVTAYLSGGEEARISAQIVEGYTRIPQAVPDEWGDLLAQTDENTGDVMDSLAEEERRAGKKPW